MPTLPPPIGSDLISLGQIQEIRNRRVDDWFRIMSDPAHDAASVAMLREYAESFGLDIPGSSEVKSTLARAILFSLSTFHGPLGAIVFFVNSLFDYPVEGVLHV